MKPHVYLAGPIASKEWLVANGWRSVIANRLAPEIQCFNPLRGKVTLVPDTGLIGDDICRYTPSPLTTAAGITGRDRNDVRTADLVIANLLNTTTKSTGTAIEFGWADAWRVPIILIMEPEGAVADHPMLRQLADFHVTTLIEACTLAKDILLP